MPGLDLNSVIHYFKKIHSLELEINENSTFKTNHQLFY